MTGPEHYQAAERLLSDASLQSGMDGTPVTRDGHPLDPAVQASMVARAQVHATLALAAASGVPKVVSQIVAGGVVYELTFTQDAHVWGVAAGAGAHWEHARAGELKGVSLGGGKRHGGGDVR